MSMSFHGTATLVNGILICVRRRGFGCADACWFIFTLIRSVNQLIKSVVSRALACIARTLGLPN